MTLFFCVTCGIEENYLDCNCPLYEEIIFLYYNKYYLSHIARNLWLDLCDDPEREVFLPLNWMIA